MDELNALNSTVEMIIVDNNACNDESFTVLNLTRFVNMKVLEVGNYSFRYVKEVHLIGLPLLERVVIGNGDFLGPNDLTGHFHVKNCERLRVLKIGRISFMGYSSIEIEDMPSLEVIEMGELNEVSGSFHDASLELKSDSERMK